MSPLLYRLLIGFLCLAGLAGCGGGRATVHGRITVSNNAPSADEFPALEVCVADPVANLSFVAPVDRDGHFTIKGDGGKGIPAGTYNIAVRNGGDRPSAHKRSPLLDGINDPEKSSLKYDVTTDADQRIVVDLAKKTVEREP